jgi:hypothetical protein
VNGLQKLASHIGQTSSVDSMSFERRFRPLFGRFSACDDDDDAAADAADDDECDDDEVAAAAAAEGDDEGVDDADADTDACACRWTSLLISVCASLAAFDSLLIECARVRVSCDCDCDRDSGSECDCDECETVKGDELRLEGLLDGDKHSSTGRRP